MPQNFARIEKVKYALSNFCNVTAIIKYVKAFSENRKDLKRVK